MTIEEQIALVKEDGAAIEQIKNPSEETQIIAVMKFSWNILFIKEPTITTQLLAVKLNKQIFNHIDNKRYFIDNYPELLL